jgi:hypothetical protein
MKSIRQIFFLCLINVACQKKYDDHKEPPIENSVWVSFYTSDSTLPQVYNHFHIDPAPLYVNNSPNPFSLSLFYKKTAPACDEPYGNGRYPFWPGDTLTIKLFKIGDYVSPSKLIGVRLTKSLCNNVDIK